MNTLNNSEGNPLISLLIPKEEAAKVIMDFLGKKEKLIYSEEGYFRISLKEIGQYNLLIEQKINKEHNSYFSFIETSIQYNDGTTRKTKNLDSYYENRLIYPISISMQWNIVVKFPESATIENQRIEIIFDTNKNNEKSTIKMVIEYSNILWASEIASSLMNQVKKDICLIDLDEIKHQERSKNKIFSFTPNNAFYIVTIIFMLLIGIKTYPNIEHEISLSESRKTTLNLLSLKDFESIPNKEIIKENDEENYDEYSDYEWINKNSIKENSSLSFFMKKEDELALYESLDKKINDLKLKKTDLEKKIYHTVYKNTKNTYDIDFILDSFFISDYFNYGADKERSLLRLEKFKEIDNESELIAKELYQTSNLLVHVDMIGKREFYKRIHEYGKRLDKIKAYFFLGIASFLLFFLLYPVFNTLYSKAYIKYHRNQSFILITEYSIKKLKNFEDKKSKLEFYSYKGVIFAIASGILSSLIYSILSAIYIYLQ